MRIIHLDNYRVMQAWHAAITERDEPMERELDWLDPVELEAVAAAAERMANFARRLARAKRSS